MLKCLLGRQSIYDLVYGLASMINPVETAGELCTGPTQTNCSVEMSLQQGCIQIKRGAWLTPKIVQLARAR